MSAPQSAYLCIWYRCLLNILPVVGSDNSSSLFGAEADLLKHMLYIQCHAESLRDSAARGSSKTFRMALYIQRQGLIRRWLFLSAQ